MEATTTRTARLPLLERAMIWVACLSPVEARAAIRDYRAGLPDIGGGEAVCHFGGPRAVIERAIAVRHVVKRLADERERPARLKDLQRAWRFFFEHAGYVEGKRAACALALARAEREAERRGWSVDWDYDEDADLGDHEFWCADARREQAGYTDGRHWQRWMRRRLGLRGKYEQGDAIPHARWDRWGHTHDAFSALLRDRNGLPLASLGGILDPDANYRRVVAAELAHEAMGDHK